MQVETSLHRKINEFAFPVHHPKYKFLPLALVAEPERIATGYPSKFRASGDFRAKAKEPQTPIDEAKSSDEDLQETFDAHRETDDFLLPELRKNVGYHQIHQVSRQSKNLTFCDLVGKRRNMGPMGASFAKTVSQDLGLMQFPNCEICRFIIDHLADSGFAR
jgi:hypothetical protein